MGSEKVVVPADEVWKITAGPGDEIKINGRKGYFGNNSSGLYAQALCGGGYNH